VLACRADTCLHFATPPLDDYVHAVAPLSARDTLRHPPGRPGLRPHIRLLRGSRQLLATTALLPARETSGPPAGQDLLLSRTVISRREVALRGPFCLRLASACRRGPSADCGRPGLAQPRTRAGAMTRT